MSSIAQSIIKSIVLTGGKAKITHSEVMLTCPFHPPDNHPSLAINPEKNCYYDFHDGRGGSLQELGQRLNIPYHAPQERLPQEPHRPAHRPNAPEGTVIRKETEERISSLRTTVPDILLERDDIARMLVEVGIKEQALRFKDCHQVFWKYQCQECGLPLARTNYCDLPICPDCRNRHLASFYERHGEKLKKYRKWGLFLTKPLDIPIGGLRKGIADLRKKFKKIRENCPSSGVYGIKLWRGEHGWRAQLVILLAGGEKPQFEFARALVMAGIVPHEPITFNSSREAWQGFSRRMGFSLDFTTKDELQELYYALANTHIVQGWGYLYRVQGWKGQKREPQKNCPRCGGNLIPMGICSREYVWWEEEEQVWCWREP